MNPTSPPADDLRERARGDAIGAWNSWEAESETAESDGRVVVRACRARNRTIRQLKSVEARNPACTTDGNLTWKLVYHSEIPRQECCRPSSDRPRILAHNGHRLMSAEMCCRHTARR